MRILYLTDIDLGVSNGPVAHVTGFTVAAAGLGHDVKIHCPPPSGPVSPELGVVSVPLPRLPLVMRPLFALTSAGFIAKQWSKPPDLIYCRVSHWTHAAVVLKRRWNCPLYCEVNGITEDHLRGAGRNFLAKKIILDHELDCLNVADRIIAVTEGIRRHVLQRDDTIPEHNVITVANAVNPQAFFPGNRAEARQRLGLPSDAGIIGYCGTLDWWQGVEILVDAFIQVAQTRPDAYLLLAGRGDDGAFLRRLQEAGLQQRVCRIGAFPWSQAPGLIAACDICVAPKRPLQSGYSPIKLYEYLACARPVVASRIAGFEFVEVEEAGLLVQPENPSALAGALTLLLDHPETRLAMGRRGRELILANHTWEQAVKKILSA